MPDLQRRKTVTTRTGLPTSTLYDMVAKGEFPKPVRISPRIVAWIKEEVDEWIEKHIAQRNASTTADDKAQ